MCRTIDASWRLVCSTTISCSRPRRRACLYHELRRTQPIIDYHCHLPPEQIAANHRFRSITEIWLDGDHYKWRAMRTNGVRRASTAPATRATGRSSRPGRARCRTTLRNPLYHWTHLELQAPVRRRPKLLDRTTAREIFEHCNELLARAGVHDAGAAASSSACSSCARRTIPPTRSSTTRLTHARPVARDVASTRRGAPTRRWPSRTRRRCNAWVERLEAASDIVDRHATTSSWTRSRSATRSSTSAGCRALRSRARDDVRRRLHGCRRARGASTRRARGESRHGAWPRRVTSPRCSTSSRSWTTRAAGCSSSTSARCATTTRACCTKLGPDTGFDSIGDFELARPARALPRPPRPERPARARRSSTT